MARLHFVALEKQHNARLEDHVELDPVLERASDLEPVRQHNDRLVAHYGEHVVGDALLLGEIVLFLLLVCGIFDGAACRLAPE